MLTNYFLKEEISNKTSSIYFVAWNKVNHFRKAVHTTKIEFIPFDVLRTPKIKSMEMSTQGIVGMGRRVYKPWGCTLDLAFLHAMHLSQKLCKDLRMWGQKKCSCNVSKVLATPKCPIRPASCASLTRDCLKDPWGTQSLFPLKRKPSWRKKSLCPPFKHS